MNAINARTKTAATAKPMYCPVLSLEECCLDRELLLEGGELGFEWELGESDDDCDGEGRFCGGEGLVLEEGGGKDGT
ncbi:hypothetical protein QL285_075441 [Trifolium repens]|jgi:hypothetical protein|nr:hypothetical protein QL285_075441 [Trifolium repens]